MSFREKTAWIALMAYGLVFGGYFFNLSRAWDEGLDQRLGIGLMVVAVIALVVITASLMVTAALITPKQANAPADERERLIELKSERIASYALSVGVVL
jgi:hypothetical protein